MWAKFGEQGAIYTCSNIICGYMYITIWRTEGVINGNFAHLNDLKIHAFATWFYTLS